MLMTWQLWLLYVVPVALALFWGLFTGFYWGEHDDFDGQNDTGSRS